MSTTADTIPFNLRRRDPSDAALDRAAEYALSVAQNYGEWVTAFAPHRAPEAVRTLAGSDVLDLGPGPTLGAALVMACAGAHVSVADRYLVSWDDQFHPAFVERLLNHVRDRGESYQQPLRRVLQANAFDSQIVRIASSAEGLDRTGKNWDIVFSNATLEHVDDFAAAARSLFHVTRPGGLGFHQIDLRDHRDFDDPLRFLTVDQQTFHAIPNAAAGDYGSRRRLPDYLRSFEDAGFTIVSATVNLRADEEYLSGIRGDLVPEFLSLTDEDLSVLGVFVCVERPATTSHA